MEIFNSDLDANRVSLLNAAQIIFAGKDIIGLAETGSGKTGAFALPVLQTLLENPQRLYALVLTPTRFVLVVLL